MLDPKSLLPEVRKLLPGTSDQEIMAGVAEFAKAHPNFDNKQALAALAEAVKPEAAQATAPAPFSGLISQLGAK